MPYAELLPQWLWLNVGIFLMAGILKLNTIRLEPRTGLALVVAALLLALCWIAVADSLTG